MHATRHLAILVVLASVAGCAEDTSTPGSPAVSPSPSPGGIWAGYVEVNITAAPKDARAGEEIRIELTMRNHMARSLWTNPAVGCTGSWDLQVYDADGARLRVDDRDAMGCPTTDTYTEEMRAGGDATVSLTWDGMLRPSLGRSEPAPPGDYVLRGIARYALEEGTSNGSGPTAAEGTDEVTVRIVG